MDAITRLKSLHQYHIYRPVNLLAECIKDLKTSDDSTSRAFDEVDERLIKLEAKAKFPLIMGGDIEKRIEKLERSETFAEMMTDLTRELRRANNFDKMAILGWTPPGEKEPCKHQFKTQKEANDIINRKFDRVVAGLPAEEHQKTATGQKINGDELAKKHREAIENAEPELDPMFTNFMTREKAIKLAKRIRCAEVKKNYDDVGLSLTDDEIADIIQEKDSD